MTIKKGLIVNKLEVLIKNNYFHESYCLLIINNI